MRRGRLEGGGGLDRGGILEGEGRLEEGGKLVGGVLVINRGGSSTLPSCAGPVCCSMKYRKPRGCLWG